MTHLYDLDVKVMDLEVLVKLFISLDTLHVCRY